jgi:hypothetical protein
VKAANTLNDLPHSRRVNSASPPAAFTMDRFYSRSERGTIDNAIALRRKYVSDAVTWP